MNLANNPENYDLVFDGNLTTHRQIDAATVNLNGSYHLNALNIHTSKLFVEKGTAYLSFAFFFNSSGEWIILSYFCKTIN